MKILSREKRAVVHEYERVLHGHILQGFAAGPLLLGGAVFRHLEHGEQCEIELPERVVFSISHYFHERETHHGLSSVVTEHLELAIAKDGEVFLRDDEGRLDMFSLEEREGGPYTLNTVRRALKWSSRTWEVFSTHFSLLGMKGNTTKIGTIEVAARESVQLDKRYATLMEELKATRDSCAPVQEALWPTR